MLHFLAIIPHHNTLSDLENIQHVTWGYPLYPLIAPLCSLADYSSTTARLTNEQLKKIIKEQQQSLVQCSLRIACPEIYKNDSILKKIICPIQGLPQFKSDYVADKEIPNPFTKDAFTLSYTEPDMTTDVQKQALSKAQPIYDKASLTMRIYRIGVVTVTKIPREQSNNDYELNTIQGFSWTISHDVWVKCK